MTKAIFIIAAKRQDGYFVRIDYGAAQEITANQFRRLAVLVERESSREHRPLTMFHGHFPNFPGLDNLPELHIAWGVGMFDVMREKWRMGLEPLDKRRTMCGLRVPNSQINNTGATCVVCVAEHDEREQALRELRDKL